MKRKLDRLQLSISAVKTATSPTKSPSPSNFLTKSSNLTGYAAWDVDGRVGDMETQFKELKAIVDTTLTERKGHDEALALAKTRGKRHLTGGPWASTHHDWQYPTSRTIDTGSRAEAKA